MNDAGENHPSNPYAEPAHQRHRPCDKCGRVFGDCETVKMFRGERICAAPCHRPASQATERADAVAAYWVAQTPAEERAAYGRMVAAGLPDSYRSMADLTPSETDGAISHELGVAYDDGPRDLKFKIHEWRSGWLRAEQEARRSKSSSTTPEFPHGAMWGVGEATEKNVDPAALEDFGDFTISLTDGSLDLDWGSAAFVLSPAATLRLRDKLNAAFPVGVK